MTSAKYVVDRLRQLLIDRSAQGTTFCTVLRSTVVLMYSHIISITATNIHCRTSELGTEPTDTPRFWEGD